LAREFASFTHKQSSKENSQILGLLREPMFRSERREVNGNSGVTPVPETEEQIGRLLEARSDAISDVARQQHELGKVR
jgi:hypothetical protein